MAEEKRNWLGPYLSQGNWIKELVQQAKLAFSLMLDPRVPALAKLIPIAVMAYIISPVDLAPASIPVLTQLDDVAVLMLGLRFFFELSPPEVVREHLRRIVHGFVGDNWKVSGGRTPPAEGGDIIDAPPPVDIPPP